jgi:hypothetical protein
MVVVTGIDKTKAENRMTTLAQIETSIAAHLRAFPSKAFTRKALGELMRANSAMMDEALRNLCLRGELQQLNIRMVTHYQCRTSNAERIAQARAAYSVKPLAKEYTESMYRHWRMAEGIGGRVA